METESRVHRELASVLGKKEVVAGIHESAEIIKCLARLELVGTDKEVGETRPRGEFHLLAVEERECHRGVKRGHGDEHGESNRLSRSRFTTDEEVVFGERDGDEVAVFANAEGLRLPEVDGPRAKFRHGNDRWEGVASDDNQFAELRIRGITTSPDASGGHARGDLIARFFNDDKVDADREAKLVGGGDTR